VVNEGGDSIFHSISTLPYTFFFHTPFPIRNPPPPGNLKRFLFRGYPFHSLQPDAGLPFLGPPLFSQKDVWMLLSFALLTIAYRSSSRSLPISPFSLISPARGFFLSPFFQSLRSIPYMSNFYFFAESRPACVFPFFPQPLLF